ncbi:MAG: MFS transporter [Paramuribaculum sp.]|nr:MFS transporter [Paramuribaculum sp.]
MGLPFVVLNMVSAVLFKNIGIPNAQIAFWTSLIMWPWTIKFLWSPFLEIFKTKKFFVVATQIICGVLFGLAAMAIRIDEPFAILIALFAVVAFSGATHDIAADGVYMSELTERDQSRYIGWQGAFYNLAKLVATGGLVGLAGYLARYFSDSDTPERLHYIDSWMIILAAIGALFLILGAYHSKIVPGRTASSTSPTAREGLSKLKEVITAFFTKRYIWYYIAFIILYRLGEGFVMKIVPLFLMSDRASGGLALSNEQIGLYYGTCGAAAFLLGSLLAGYYIARRGLKKSLFSLCCIFNIPFVAYALLAYMQPESMVMIAGAIIVEYFGYGFGFVGLTLFMMQQVAPGKHQMAHYAFASGIMNFSVMLTGAVSGYLSDWLGYSSFFTVVMIATVPAFLMTWFLPFSYPDKSAENLKQEIENDSTEETGDNRLADAGYSMGGETQGN